MAPGAHHTRLLMLNSMHWHCCLGGKQRWKKNSSKCHFRVETTGATFRNILNLKQLQPVLSMLFLFILLSLSGSSQSHVSPSFLFPSVLFNKFIYLPDLFIPQQQFCYSVDSSFKLCLQQEQRRKITRKQSHRERNGDQRCWLCKDKGAKLVRFHNCILIVK